MNFPENLAAKLNARTQQNAMRELPLASTLIDFSSNDYLGFARRASIFEQSHQLLLDRNIICSGATGSRLISGNHALYKEAENAIAKFHNSESALIFNSGYDANVGFFSSVLQRGDVVLFDELCHASIRDGIRLSNAKALKFGHNDYEDLELLLEKHSKQNLEIYVATESVFSMDGDSPVLDRLITLQEKFQFRLIVDEAHALGIFGENGEGLVQHLRLEDKIFARIMTFGKGLGCHGAAVLGSQQLKQYLVNFARSFIYTTGLPPHSIATILIAYQNLGSASEEIQRLNSLILHFNRELNLLGMKPLFVKGKSAIQSAIIPGNRKVRDIAIGLGERGFNVKAILSPTVPEGQERLRVCLHSYNSTQEIDSLLRALSQLLF